MSELVTFRITGARFDEMPMARVAEFIAALSKLCGPCTLVKIGKRTITFEVH